MLALLLTIYGCEGFLDQKPTKSLVIPQTVSELEGLLDNVNFQMNNSPSLIFTGTDDFWTTDPGFVAFNSIPDQNSYLWKEEIYDTPEASDWVVSYRQIFYANVVLDEASRITPESSVSLKKLEELKARALFLRGKSLFDLAGQFAPVYQASTADQELGLVIRTIPKITDKQGRATLRETYQRIISDVEAAEPNLPDSEIFPTRPTRTAAQALLARIYLSMSDFENANRWAKIALNAANPPLDFNQTMSTGNFSFTVFNRETLFYSVMTSQIFHFSNLTFVDPQLYNSYEANDLRKTLFYRRPTATAPGFVFRGSYSGDFALFSGLTTGELYLIAAETEVRLGRPSQGVEYLNSLLKFRYKSGTFTPYSGLSQAQALDLILKERRKELAFRGLRWSDLRRLNLNPTTATTLTRTVAGESYTLLPNSPRYVFPIPEDELKLNGLQPNNR